MFSDEHYMQLALQQARRAYDAGEVPVGAIVIQENSVLGRGYNQVELLKDPTAHAEMIALTAAFSYLGAKYLGGATLYVTIEPCHMCAGALYWSKIGRIVYGAEDIKHGYRRFLSPASANGDAQVINSPFHPKTLITGGVLAHECSELMRSFFQLKR